MLPGPGSGCGKGNTILNADVLAIPVTNRIIFKVQLLLSFSPKVTGKKVYAAGQWSSAAVSSLLTPKPQEPFTKEPASSQPQVNSHIDLLSRFIMINMSINSH